MSEFKREERYIVIKRNHLDPRDESKLRDILDREYGVETVDCVVVESDWPNYEATWNAIQQIAEGTYDGGKDQ